MTLRTCNKVYYKEIFIRMPTWNDAEHCALLSTNQKSMNRNDNSASKSAGKRRDGHRWPHVYTCIIVDNGDGGNMLEHPIYVFFKK